MNIFERFINFDLDGWIARRIAAVKATVADVRGRWAAYTGEVRQAQLDFNAKMERAADVVGVCNVERLMDGQPPQMEVNVWDDINARRAAAVAAFNAIPPKREEKPWKGSAREAQINFNKACEAYRDKYGIVALEKALTPPPSPVPVSDPEPPKRRDRRYRYPEDTNAP
jgi:hypothetical protein